MHTVLRSLPLFAGLLLAGTAVTPQAHATAKLQERLADRYEVALQRAVSLDSSVPRPAELSDQDLAAFSGVGLIACTVDTGIQTSTAFLVGAFDIGVTVAHTFENGRKQVTPTDCVYTSIDSQGQVRERIPVAYVRSQWDAEAGAFGQPSKDIAVFRLSEPSRYAQKTMPLGRFTGAAAPVVMVGYKADIGWATIKRKATGQAYALGGESKSAAKNGRFTHDMDARGIAPGAPVIDERTGVIIGIHTRLPGRGKSMDNGMITMTDWLESTLRSEIQLKAKNDGGTG
ncbi:MAG TPA: trypsin-like peptidase domain-containing protein [Steroidobacteraceae bacterium]|nr:trypsin-like peptidase domain-containing protein [Steroidobacteraceae bacterium]